jgi:hypothetical protein
VTRVPVGTPDFLGLTPLATVDYAAGDHVTYDGRPAVVCVPCRRSGPLDDRVLIRYLAGNRERVLVSEWECAVGVEW